MAGILTYEMFWEGQPIGQLIEAEPDMPYVEGKWASNGSVAATKFSKLIEDLFASTTSVHWTFAPKVELFSSSGHRSRDCLLTGMENGWMLIRW